MPAAFSAESAGKGKSSAAVMIRDKTDAGAFKRLTFNKPPYDLRDYFTILNKIL
jgi:hypothetical protein